MTTNKPGSVNQMKLKQYAIIALIATGLWCNLTTVFWFYWVATGLILLGLVVLISAAKNPKYKDEEFQKNIKPLTLLDITVRHAIIGSALVHTESWNTLSVFGVQVFLMLIFLVIVKQHAGGQYEIT